MGATYREVEDVNYGASWMNVKLNIGFRPMKPWACERSGKFHRLTFYIEDDETDELYFSKQQYWCEDDDRGILLNDKGERKLFDTETEMMFYVYLNKSSKIDVVLNKMKLNGFQSLTEEEKVLLKDHNKNQKQQLKTKNNGKS